MVIVGSQHLCSHGLAEASATSHTDELLFSEESLVDYSYQPRLVDVLAVAYLAESKIPLVDVDAHVAL